MIWIIGKGGQLGTALERILADDNFTITHESEVDICNRVQIKAYIETHKPTAIINASAYTAVDKAETAIELAYNINYSGVKNLVDLSNYYDIPTIHISTDFVFNGRKNIAYKEDDRGDPLNIYGKSKLAGDKYILNHARTAIIFRTSWLYDAISKNFLTIMQELGEENAEITVVSDQIGTPTYVDDLGEVIVQAIPKIKKGVVELYNYSDEGVASWYDFAHAIMDFSKIDCQVIPIKAKDYPTPATRPHFGVLDKDKIRTTFNIEIPHWLTSLKQAISTQD